MKQLLVLVLIIAVCGVLPVFAEEESSLSVNVDSAADALYMRRFTGDYAERDEAAKQGSPYPYQGEGDTGSFKTSMFTDVLAGNAALRYQSANYGGMLSVKGTVSPGGDTLPSFTFGDWNAWLRFGKWGRLFFGNTAQRGSAALHQNFDDFLRPKIDGLGIMLPSWTFNTEKPLSGDENEFDLVNEFPWGYRGKSTNRGYGAFTGSDTTDLFIPAGTTSRQQFGVLLDFNFWEPLTLTASLGGLFDNITRPFQSYWNMSHREAITNIEGYDTTNDPRIQNRMNFGVRAEYTLPEKLAFFEKPSVQAVFKYSSAALTKLEVTETSYFSTIDTKAKNFTMGLYMNASLPIDLALSLGWSAYSRHWRNRDKDTVYKIDWTVGSVLEGEQDWYLYGGFGAVLFPFYNGIDLRASYTPSFLPALRITFNNNFTFSSMRGIDPTIIEEKYYASGWAYAGANSVNNNPLNSGGANSRKEIYNGWYSALGARYSVSKVLAFDMQLANQLGVFTLHWEEEPVTSSANRLGVYLGAAYTLSDNSASRLTVRSGFALDANSYVYQYFRDDFPKYEAGYFNLGIPIGIKLEFSPAMPKAMREQLEKSFREAILAEAERQETIKQEMARLEEERIVAEHREAERRQEEERLAALRREEEQLEAFRQELARQEEAYREALRQEADRLAEEHREALRLEEERLEMLRQELASKETTLQESRQRTWLVRKDDTLVKIADWIYGDPTLWTRIYEANRDRLPKMDNPNYILPGIELRIPEK